MWIPEGKTIGIDLGTIRSALAELDGEGRPILVPNADGSTATSSIVVLGESGHVVVGPSPQRISVESPSNVVTSVKRRMGNKEWRKNYQGFKLTPEFMAALILKKLKQDGERTIGSISNAVIAVPRGFGPSERKATLEAGRIAGLNIIDLIPDPTAVALAYAWVRDGLSQPVLGCDPRTILVADLGGFALQTTIVQYTNRFVNVLAADSDESVGGLEWTNRLAEFVAEQVRRASGHDLLGHPAFWPRLMQECETAKRQLSSGEFVSVEVSYFGSKHTVTVTRSEFERLTADLVQKARAKVASAMRTSVVESGQIPQAVPVGGATLMPAVSNMLSELTGSQLTNVLDPNEAVAQGAAIQAAILEARDSGAKSLRNPAVTERLRAVRWDQPHWN